MDVTGNDQAMTKDNRILETFKKHKNEMLILGTWNVRGTNESGTLKNLSMCLTQYKIDILALQETKQKTNDITVVDDYIFFSSGNDTRYFGTGFMVKKELKQKVINFEPVSERICTIRLRGMYRKISIINVHAPTNEKDEEEKDNFYVELERIINSTPKYDLKIVMGDLNAKLGKEEMYKTTIDAHSKHDETNENGHKLIEFAITNNMKVMSTHFERKDIYKGTWISPDGRTCNQIDHVLIESKHARQIKNVKSRRGAELDTDHFLVKIVMKQELQKETQEKLNRLKRYDTLPLTKENSREQFQNLLSKEMELAEQVSEETVDIKWNKLEGAILKISEKMLRKNGREKNKEWFDEECKSAIRKRDMAKRNLLHNSSDENKLKYNMHKRRTKQLCRLKKRKMIEEKMIILEEDFKNKELRNFYQEAKKQKTGYQPPLVYCKNNEGELVTAKDKLNVWEKYFKDVLNERNLVTETTNETETTQQEGNNTEQNPPDINEIRETLNLLKNSKSPGINGITSEIYKNAGDEVIQYIVEIIEDVWRTERMPERWKEALICPIYKKGDRLKCENYRGIALLDVAYKILAGCLKNRIQKQAKNILGEYQAGFRANRSTTDQIFALKQIIANSYEHKLSLQMLFIDFKQAYDTIKKHKLYEALADLGIPKKLIRLIKMTHEKTKCRILVEGETSESFDVNRGLRQGDPVSPVLFNLALEWVIRKSRIYTKGTIYQLKHQCLAFADDIALITRTKIELKEVFKRLVQTAEEMGLKINEEKTKYMEIESEHHETLEDSLKIQVVGGKTYAFKKVHNFVYLGVTLTNNNSEERDILTRITKGNRSAGAMRKLLKSKSVSRSAKKRLYKTIIRPVVLYGSEMWVLSKTMQNKLEVWERQILRKIYGGKKGSDVWLRRTNTELMELYSEPGIVEVVKAQRLRWLGHVLRLPEDRVAKKVLDGGVVKKKRRGRPKERWYDSVKKDLETLGITNFKLLAQDRKKWRKIVTEAMGLLGLQR